MFVRWRFFCAKSIVLNLTYQSLNGDPNKLENCFKNILSKQEITNKELVLARDFKVNVFDFNERKMVQSFVNLMFRHGLIPTVNKLTRDTKNTATAIDHIITRLLRELNRNFSAETTWNWNEVKQSNNANECYAKFPELCTSLHEECFPKFKIRLNQRKNLIPWISKGIKKSSKRK